MPSLQVTGFLGAGKTTLLNDILRQKGQRRVAVIENEVGEINIDNSLVVENLLSKEDLVSMDRGCVCCSLRHDIVKALGELQARGEQRGVAYDHIMLETTGLADPAPVAFTFFSNAWISSNFRIDSILCLVDAQHVARHLADADSGDVNEAVNQIAFADVVLLNKIDLVSPAELQAARDLVRSINVTADVLEVQLNGAAAEGSVPAWDRLMGINSFSIERALQVDPTFMDSDSDDHDEEEDGNDDAAAADAGAGAAGGGRKRRRAPRGRPAAGAADDNNAAAEPSTEPSADGAAGPEAGGDVEGPSGGGAACAADVAADPELSELLQRQQAAEAAASQRQPKRRRKKLHDGSGVGSVGITAPGPLDKYRFNAFMRDLLSERARDIFRCKGVLCIKGQERTKFVFQGVHETICFGPAASSWAEGEQPLSQVVFIGRGLPRRDLLEGLRSCVWVPLPEGWTEHADPRSGRPYYVDVGSGAKQWDRPADACALARASESSHEQPSALQPRSSLEAAA
jgi:G3E family GTPase